MSAQTIYNMGRKSGRFDEFELHFHLPETFKGLSKEYIIDKVFNDDIQDNWVPQIGDLMVGPTGNIYAIGAIDKLHEKLGGIKYYFGGGMCSRDGSSQMKETFCYTINESGDDIGWGDNGLEIKDNPYHGKISNYKFIPYPHELKN